MPHIPIDALNPNNFWSKVSKRDDGCWEWIGRRVYGPGSDSYGRIKIRGGLFVAHRVSYELNIGPIPDGLQLDHLCRHRWCVNPDHLEPVTQYENMRRGTLFERAGSTLRDRTHCKNGHEFTDENTRWTTQGLNQYRKCRACDREAHRRKTNPNS